MTENFVARAIFFKTAAVVARQLLPAVVIKRKKRMIETEEEKEEEEEEEEIEEGYHLLFSFTPVRFHHSRCPHQESNSARPGS